MIPYLAFWELQFTTDTDFKAAVGGRFSNVKSPYDFFFLSLKRLFLQEKYFVRSKYLLLFQDPILFSWPCLHVHLHSHLTSKFPKSCCGRIKAPVPLEWAIVEILQKCKEQWTKERVRRESRFRRFHESPPLFSVITNSTTWGNLLRVWNSSLKSRMWRFPLEIDDYFKGSNWFLKNRLDENYERWIATEFCGLGEGKKIATYLK